MPAKLIIVLVCISTSAMAQLRLNGVVREEKGDVLPSASVFLLPDSVTIATDGNGKFSISTNPGSKIVRVQYVGYQAVQNEWYVLADTTLLIELTPAVNQLHEVVVKGDRYSLLDMVKSTRSSTNTLTKNDLESIPVLGGEADVIKTIQLMPGTSRGVEGSTDYFVRGGAADQNLVLLDDVPIYNTSHLFGFVSVFNPDIVERVESVNGAFPADFGGRLSSVLAVQTNNAIADETFISGDVGLLASRLYVELPLVKDKAGIWIAGRRTYIDQVVKAVGEELPYFFYDLNGKIMINPSPRDRVEVSYYGGRDVLDIFRDNNNDGDGFLTTYQAGNNSQSVRWNRSLSKTWQAQFSAIRSKYEYKIFNSFEENSLLALSDIEDVGIRIQLTQDSLKNKSFFKTGFDWTRHQVSPNVINTSGFVAELLEGSETQGRVANEMAWHAQYEFPLAKRWVVNTGLRASFTTTESKNYFFPEPRVSIRYDLPANQSIKFSYSRMVQYIHRISNSAVTSPTDIWYPVTDRVKPQSAHQVSASWQRYIARHDVFISIDSYYKDMRNLIGYEEGTNLFFNNEFESKLIQGKGRAYGFEWLVKKQTGNFTGWISYTLSWSRRQFDELNQSKWFYSRYDRRHNGAIVMQYKWHPRWAVSTVWEYISGARFTPVVGQYVLFAPTLSGVDLIPLYTEVNEVTLANTHRLDVGIKFKSKPNKKFQWQWFAGVYNAYNRANPIGITIEQNNDGSLRYEQPGLFGLLPFISYGFSF